jgi:hypothetical protein
MSNEASLYLRLTYRKINRKLEYLNKAINKSIVNYIFANLEEILLLRFTSLSLRDEKNDEVQ